MRPVSPQVLIALVIATALVGVSMLFCSSKDAVPPSDIATEDVTFIPFPTPPVIVGEHYRIEGKKVYWTFPNIREVVGADAKTFTSVYGPTAIYARDKSHLYVTGVRADGVDPDTFAAFSSSLYVRDASAVYILEPIEVMTDYRYALRRVDDADPATIRQLPELGQEYAADATHLYRDGQIVSDIHGGTLKTSLIPYVTDRSSTHYFDYSFREHGLLFLSPTTSVSVFGTSMYARIGDTIYYASTSVPGADPDTFNVLQGTVPVAADEKQPSDFAKDRDQVYFRGVPVSGADPATFVPVDSGVRVHVYGKDDTAVYFKTNTIEGADPKTFVPVGQQQPYKGCPDGRYSVDATSVYFEHVRIPGADPASFQVVNGLEAYGQDEENFYVGGTTGEKKDFKPCEFG